MRHRSKASRFILTTIALAMLQACGALPPKPHAYEMQVPAQAAAGYTGLERTARASLPTGYRSGFRLLTLPQASWDARMALIERAEKSIAAQYYYIGGDASGSAFLQALADAGRRGVQVSLLVDDLLTADVAGDLALLSAVPNVEVRLFNPFCCARRSLATRLLVSALDLGRLNRRMHNKLLVVDGAFALTGGRNISDEYFGRGRAGNFIDLDMLMSGEIVGQLASVFNRYWESEPAWPVTAFSRAAAEAPLPPPVSPMDQAPGPIRGELAAGVVALAGGTGFAFADPPNKVLAPDEGHLREAATIARLRDVVRAAKAEVQLASPYVIPRIDEMDNLRALTGSGVRVTILTNSLRATDSLLAHAAYAKYRQALLATGVELYELGAADGASLPFLQPGSAHGASKGTLHVKTAVVDRESVFVGSLNLDPRSSDSNTELGVWIESAALAGEVCAFLDTVRDSGSYELMQRPGSGRLTWRRRMEAGASAQLQEPDSDPLLRLLVDILALFGPQDWL